MAKSSLVRFVAGFGRRIRCAAILALCAQFSHAAVESQVHLEEDQRVLDVAVTAKQIADWARPFMARVESLLAESGAKRYLVVQMRLHPDRDAEVLSASEPPQAEEDAAEVVRLAKSPLPARSSLIDATLSFHFKVAGASKAPVIPSPAMLAHRRFADAGTAERLSLLAQMARTEALPVLGAIASRVQQQFAGVRELGKALNQAVAMPASATIDAPRLADRSATFWRAVVEMARGDTLPVVARIYLDVANGQLDRAREWSRVTLPFTAKEPVARYYLELLAARLATFYPGVDRQIRDGISLFDDKKLQEARQSYEALLKDYPCSAWGHHELALTFNQLGDDAAYRKSQAAVFACNPMYTRQIRIATGVEAYRLQRRIELEKLFRDSSRGVADFSDYADIALDLGEPAIAAHVLWRLVHLAQDKKQMEERLELFLYALEQLGVTELKSSFQGDHTKAFATIEARRRQARESSPAYRKMKDPGSVGGVAPEGQSPQGQSPERQAVATLVGITGNVEVRTGPSGEWRAAQKGQQLLAGDLVRTSEGSVAAILFADKTQVKLSQTSQFQIRADGENAQVNLSLKSRWRGKSDSQDAKDPGAAGEPSRAVEPAAGGCPRDTERFRDAGPMIFVDQSTRLVWAKCPFGQKIDPATRNCSGAIWATEKLDFARSAAENLAKNTGSAWRLPTIEEISTLAEATCGSRAFAKTPLSDYGGAPIWTSSPAGENQIFQFDPAKGGRTVKKEDDAPGIVILVTHRP